MSCACKAARLHGIPVDLANHSNAAREALSATVFISVSMQRGLQMKEEVAQH